ncbi:unnamed protein product [Arctogadus glacialis]
MWCSWMDPAGRIKTAPDTRDRRCALGGQHQSPHQRLHVLLHPEGEHRVTAHQGALYQDSSTTGGGRGQRTCLWTDAPPRPDPKAALASNQWAAALVSNAIARPVHTLQLVVRQNNGRTCSQGSWT